MSARRRSNEAGSARGGRVLRFVRRLPARRAEFDPLHAAERPDVGFEGRWQSGLKARLILVLCVLALWGAGVEARLVYLQVFRHTAMLAKAKSQEQELVHPVGVRGDIVDRNGEPLAFSVPATAIIASPKDINVAAQAANGAGKNIDGASKTVNGAAKTVDDLCGALQDCTPQERIRWLASFATTKPNAYVRRSDAVSPAQAERIEALKKKHLLVGITLVPDTQRYYPARDLAAQVIGFVGDENAGLAGIEASYENTIKGQPGAVRVFVDARRESMDTRVEQAPTTGATVELTIDKRLQYITERELAAGIAEHHAEAGMAVILDPNNGEVLALANWPTFNLNNSGSATQDELRNRAVQGAFEPGSMMKIVTASTALEEHIASLADWFDTDPGYLQIGSRRIHDAEGHNNGVLSFTDVVVHSSNVGAGKIGLKIGPERLYRYVKRFGFGDRLLKDLQGQSAGRVFAASELNDSALASMAIGYQIMVTPIQMASAASVVANGGTLYEPHLVRALIRDGVREPVAPNALRRVISPETAATMRSILEQVVQRGTAMNAQLDGFVAAGKTGTAAKLVDHVYSTTAYNASFVGFVPSQHPVLTIIVVIDTPHTGGTHGGEVAAPVFKRIAEASLRALRVLPTVTPPTSITVAPAATSARAVPVSQAVTPAPIVLKPGDDTGLRMPDLTGLTAREALRAIGHAGLMTRLTGAGVVTSQTPRAGDPIEAGCVAMVQLGRPAPPRPDSTRAAASGGGR
jgi:cell division protein FtsI (penicillin-binding protein 3)